jgi:UDP-N-acetylmuramoyl-L-alanyl-D-glutamate--2,6-diaminopimelate ligase
MTAAGPMLALRLDEIARELPLRVALAGDGSVRVSGVRHDSRAVRSGDLFVARPGAKVDGARFVDDAIARGAIAVMAAFGAVDAAAVPVPVLFVDDVVGGLAHAASAVYGQPSFALDVVGITGTNGKTTTAHLVQTAIDGAIGRETCGVLGTLGHRFAGWEQPTENTTPEADDVARALDEMHRRGATHAAMEVSSHALALGRVRALRFRVAALTNVTQDHLDFHGSMAAYAEAKARLFTELGPGGVVLNVDDPFGLALVGRVRAPLLRVSAHAGATPGEADVAPRSLTASAQGFVAVVRTPQGDATVASRLLGMHNVENVVLSLAIACALELDVARAALALSSAPAPPGRLERCDVEGDSVVVLVDYAHTPDALARVLGAVREVTEGRIFCVFGCGGDRDPTKRAPMGSRVGQLADVAIVTSDNPRTEDPVAIAAAVAEGVRSAGKEPVVELDRRRAIAWAVRSATAGDVVLVAGKGHEDYQLVGTVKYPFDDRTEARRALAMRREPREAP